MPRRQRIAAYTLVVALCLSVSVSSSTTARRLRSEVDTQLTDHTVDTSNTANGATVEDPNGVHVLTDDTGTWHLVGTPEEVPTSHAPTPTTHAPAATPSTTEAAPSKSPISSTTRAPALQHNKTDSSGSGMHTALIELQEKVDGKKLATASSAATHHRTPMDGFMLVGAIAILCVGIAAGISKRKNAKADGRDDAIDH